MQALGNVLVASQRERKSPHSRQGHDGFRPVADLKRLRNQTVINLIEN